MVPTMENSALITQVAIWFLIKVEDGERTMCDSKHFSNFNPILEMLELLLEFILYRSNITLGKSCFGEQTANISLYNKN